MREIVLDTETTGLDPLNGDRLVEIGCIELFNRLPTGKTYHTYLNPERDMPDDAARVHGLTTEFLSKKPVFAEQVDPFLSFIAQDPLVIHNAPFDLGFLNAELVRLGFSSLPPERAVDTLVLARRKFPGAPASLDALCKRFGVDASARAFHGALLDAQLLAEVYLEMQGGRQPGFDMAEAAQDEATELTARVFRQPRTHAPTEQESGLHEEFLRKIKNPLWKRAE